MAKIIQLFHSVVVVRVHTNLNYCEINYTTIYVIYLTFEGKFGEMKRIDDRYFGPVSRHDTHNFVRYHDRFVALDGLLILKIKFLFRIADYI